MVSFWAHLAGWAPARGPGLVNWVSDTTPELDMTSLLWPWIKIFCGVDADEHFHIREWVAYHASIGVGRVYLYDDGSQPPMHEVLAGQ